MRQQARFPVETTVFVELASPEFGSNESGFIAKCKSVEISSGGLRIRLDKELLQDAILQVAVELPADAGTHYLVAEVRWSRPIPDTGADPGWEAGLTLLNADDSDIEKWQALVALMVC